MRAADAKHVSRQARAAVIFENLQDFFALPKGVKKNGHGANVERVGAQPKQVARDPVQLGHDHTNVLRPRRSGHAEQFLDGLAISEAVGNRGDVVHAIQRGHELSVRLRLAQLFNAAMQISDHALGVDDPLAVELEFHLQHSVRRRVLRPHADRYFTSIE